MNLYGYIVGLLTIVSGLALTETAIRLSRLIEYRRTVRWDVQPLVCTLLGVSTLVVNWSIAWRPDNSLSDASFVAFVVALMATLLLFLTVASSLPSDIAHDTDLREFYARQGPVFWCLFTITLGQFVVRMIIREHLPTWVIVSGCIIVGLGATLIFWRNRVFNMIASVTLIVLILGPALLNDF